MPCLGRSLLVAVLAGGTLVRGLGAQTPEATPLEQSGQAPLRYPTARLAAQVDDYHGVRVADPYRWLEDANSRDTREWLAAEDALTSSYFSALPQRAAIRARLATLFQYTRYSSPVRAGDRLFWSQHGAGDQPVVYVKEPEASGGRVLLDGARLSTDGGVALVAVAPAPDGRYLAYEVSVSGSDWRRICVRDVRTGRDLQDDLHWIRFSSIAWTHDSRGFFYERYDSTSSASGGATSLAAVGRGQKVFFHRVGQAQQRDQLIYESPEHPDWMFRVRVSDDGQYAVISIRSGSDERNRLYFIDLDNPGRPRVSAPIVRLFDNLDARYDFVSSRGQTFYVRTTRNAPRGQLVAVDINEPHEAQWQPIVREGLDAMVDARQVGNRFVVHFLRDAHSRLALYTLDGQSRGEVTLPSFSTVTDISSRAGDPDFFFTVASFLSPPAVYDYDTDARVDLLYRMPALDADLSPFETKQVLFTSRDGTQVPMFVTARKGLVLDGRSPTLLVAGDGVSGSATPRFSPAILAWLEMGGVYAVPALRGGGEFGTAWREAGMLDRKQTAFDDFLGAARFLIAQGYTAPHRLAIAGAADGGLVVGAALTQRPDLFAAALPSAGVLDMLRYQRFGMGWAWVPEYGSADDPRQVRYLLAYSPVHNVRRGMRYPATLVTTAEHDERVVPLHSYKFTAALQAAQAGDAPILLRLARNTRVAAGTSLAPRLDEATDWLAFVAHALDVHATTRE